MPSPRAVTVQDPQFLTCGGFALDPATATRQTPDECWLLDGARCSLWHNSPPTLDGKRVGYIGHFAALDQAPAVALLRHTAERLQSLQCEIAIGPIDGNTWQRYRLITERGDEPLFFLEPDNPDSWPAFFLEADFQPLAHYTSALNTNLAAADPRLPAIAQRVHDRNIRLRPLELSKFDEELHRVFALSLLSFRDNFLYSPLPEDEFLSMYRGLSAYLRADLCFMAEHQSELAGYILAIPDLLRAKRGQPIDTVIIKTMAVHPTYAGLGLGTLLMARAHEAAHRAGFTRAIHALMHESNRSGKISSHSARVFRRYTLYSRALTT